MKLEEGRRFVEQVQWEARRMHAMKLAEKARAQKELKAAWDRDTHVRNVIKLRRKVLKRGGFIAGSKPPTPQASPLRSVRSSRRSGRTGAKSKSQKRATGRMVKANLSATTSAMIPEVVTADPDEPQDMSVGYDMRTGRR